MLQVSTRRSMNVDDGSDILWCPAEIVVWIIGGSRKRLGGRDSCNTLNVRLWCKVITEHELTPRALDSQPVCPLYDGLLSNDSCRIPVLAQNIAWLNEVVVIGRKE